MTETSVYGGRYELRNQIGRGGTAQVYLARDLRLDRPVALKVLMAEYSHDHSFVERFRREAQAAANLSHPNIVPVFDWGETEHTYFIVMEYVDGEPLSSIIRSQAPLAPAQAASVAADIAKALSYAHRHQVVHRDVKPGNVLITADGQVKVTDFGIARAIGSDDQVTQTGLVMGTATYFSPEQAQGLEVDGRSDVYSLGVVLFEMVTGRAPFTGDNPVSIAYQHVREVAPTPRALNPDVPADLEAIVQMAMAKNLADRYATAEDLRADLERFLRGQPVHASAGASNDATTAMARADTTTISAVPAAPKLTSTDRPRSNTPRWIAAGITLLVALGLIVFFAGRSLGWFGGTTYVKVPNVKGMTGTAAAANVRQHHLVPVIQTVQGTVKNSGKVIGQDPAFPATIAKGSRVTLDVAGAVKTAKVPDVRKLSASAATAELQAANFQVQQKPVTGTAAQNGQVIAENPGPNEAKPLNTVVTISVVTGAKFVTVPDLSNLSQAQAGAKLAAAQLQVGTTTQRLSVTVPAGDVITSSPAAGQSATEGSAVDLIVSEGGVTIPDVSSQHPLASDAQAQLQAAGLTSRLVSGDPAPTPDLAGTIERQSPAAGKPVAPGRLITLYEYTSSAATTTTSLPVGNSGTATSST